MYDLRKLLRTTDLADTSEYDRRNRIRTGYDDQRIYRSGCRDDDRSAGCDRGNNEKEESLTEAYPPYAERELVSRLFPAYGGYDLTIE